MVREKDRESKKEKDVRGEKKGKVREPSYTHQSIISKNDPTGSRDGMTHIWLPWIYLFSDTQTLTHTLKYTENKTHPSSVTSTSANSHQAVYLNTYYTVYRHCTHSIYRCR